MKVQDWHYFRRKVYCTSKSSTLLLKTFINKDKAVIRLSGTLTFH